MLEEPGPGPMTRDPEQTARMARVLGASARVRMLELLKTGPLCVNALAARLDMTAPAVSQHLRVLRAAGLVRGRKHGNFVHYYLDETGMARWREAMDELLTIGAGAGAPCEQQERPAYCPATGPDEPCESEEEDDAMCKGRTSGCQHPDRLQGRPEECSPEQIRKCHGEGAGHPCVADSGCQHPDRLKGRPEECSPEQIRRCHGDVTGHPCV